MLQFVSVATIQIIRVFLFPEKKKTTNHPTKNLIIAVTFTVPFLSRSSVNIHIVNSIMRRKTCIYKWKTWFCKLVYKLYT